MNTPLLSVCLITYNHVNFIKDAVDGVLMQNVTFNWELIIADDFSTDGTRQILLDYKKKHPEFIKLILQEKNVGAAKNWIDLITTPKSKYIAYFEGDDYWTDPNKLQKQVDFLEANPEFSMHCHNAMVQYENNIKQSHLFNLKPQRRTLTIADIINNWNIPTASILLRKDALIPLPDWFKNIHNGDYGIGLLAANQGLIGYSEDIMSVYRKNFGAMSFNPKINAEYNVGKLILLINLFNKETKYKYDAFINKRIDELKQLQLGIIRKRKFPLLFPLFLLKKILFKLGIKVYKKNRDSLFGYNIVKLPKRI